MAKARTKTMGANMPVPQSDADAEQLIARIGAVQRDLATSKADHDARVALLEEAFAHAKKAADQEIEVATGALNIWASANRERLTGGGKTKTVQLATGLILWRDGKVSVTHRGFKVEEIVSAVRDAICAIEIARDNAIRRSDRGERDRLNAELAVVERFLRTSVTLNKEAMHEARAIAETIPGIAFSRPGEDFVVEPLASQIREVA